MSQQGFNAIALSIPVFFLLIGLEIWLERRERKALYRLNDTINDLACGTIQQLAGVFGKTVLFAGYILLFERFAFFRLDPGNWAHWPIAFLGIDFFYYWFHRASHEVNFLWAAHIVHHQSEEYNLSVALRQSAIQQFLGAPFYWPLALLGVPPMMFLALDAFDTLYQFWIHTRTIGRMGFLEGILNTPSNHRVHHGSNAKYIDRNHGGVLIVWDRLFGTFVEEDDADPCVYGTRSPLRSWDPIAANLQVYRELLQASRAARRWRDKLRVWIAPPGWQPADLAALDRKPAFDLARVARYDPPQQPARLAAAALLFVAALAATSVLLWNAQRWPLVLSLAVGLVVLALLVAVARLTTPPPAAMLAAR